MLYNETFQIKIVQCKHLNSDILYPVINRQSRWQQSNMDFLLWGLSWQGEWVRGNHICAFDQNLRFVSQAKPPAQIQHLYYYIYSAKLKAKFPKDHKLFLEKPVFFKLTWIHYRVTVSLRQHLSAIGQTAALKSKKKANTFKLTGIFSFLINGITTYCISIAVCNNGA